MHSKMLEHYAMTANGTAPEIVDGDTREDYKAFGIEYHKHEPYVVNDVDTWSGGFAIATMETARARTEPMAMGRRRRWPSGSSPSFLL